MPTWFPEVQGTLEKSAPTISDDKTRVRLTVKNWLKKKGTYPYIGIHNYSVLLMHSFKYSTYI